MGGDSGEAPVGGTPVTWEDVWRETRGWCRDAASDLVEAVAARVERWRERPTDGASEVRK